MADFKITAPDGKSYKVTAPEGATAAEVQAIAAHYIDATSGNKRPVTEAVSNLPPQRSSALSYAARAGSAVAKGALTGLGVPGDVEALAAKGVEQFVNPHLPESLRMPPNVRTIMPTSAELVEAGGRNRLIDRNDMVPGYGQHPALERYINAAGQGVGAAIPMLAFGPANAILPTLAAGAGGGAGQEFARQHDLGPSAQFAAGVAGGIGGGKLATGLQRTTNAILGNFGPEGEAFAAAGAPMRSAAYTSSNAATRALLSPSAPLHQTQRDLGAAIEETAATLGHSRTMQEAGEVLQEDARNWMRGMGNAHAVAWAPVDALVPGAAQTPLHNTMAALANMNTQAGPLQGAVDQLRAQLPARLQATLQGAGTATWDDVRALRTALGDARARPKILEDVSTADLTRLYAAVSQDLGATAAQYGAQDAFTAANAESTRLFNFADRVLGKVITSINPAQERITPEKAAEAMLGLGRTGGTNLALLRNEIPDAVDELAAAKLRIDGLTDPTDPASPVHAAFSARWSGIPDRSAQTRAVRPALAPEARTALYPDPATRDRLSAVAHIASGLRVPPEMAKETAPALMGRLTAGGTAGFLADAALEHIPSIASHLPSTNLLLPAALATASAVGPPALRGARFAAANNPILARYAATNAPSSVGQIVAPTAGAMTNQVFPFTPVNEQVSKLPR